MSDDIETEIREIVKVAKDSFKPAEHLQGRGYRTDTLTLYTDEVTADELGHAEDIPAEKNMLGITVKDAYRSREGVLGELDVLDPEVAATKKEYKALEKRAAELRAKLKATAYTLKMSAVPEVVIEKARRDARKTLGIKGKPSEDQQEDYNQAVNAHVQAAVIQSYIVHEEFIEVDGLDFEGAVAFRHFFPPSEYLRLLKKVGELQFKQSITESAVGDADF